VNRLLPEGGKPWVSLCWSIKSARSESRQLLKLPQLREQLGALGYRARLIDFGPTDLTFAVDDECGALVHAALVVEDTVGFTDCAVRPVVRQQGKGNAAELFSPGLETGNGIGADLEYFDVQLLEFFEVRTEPADLILSSTRESEGKKRDDRGASAETRERDCFAHVGCERKIRRCATWLKCHETSPCCETAMPCPENTTKPQDDKGAGCRGDEGDESDGSDEVTALKCAGFYGVAGAPLDA
jgi:hypothetical protein